MVAVPDAERSVRDAVTQQSVQAGWDDDMVLKSKDHKFFYLIAAVAE